MGTQIATIRNTSGNWVQFNEEALVKDDLLYCVKGANETSYFAYIDSATDTRLYVFKCTEAGTITDGSNFCTITTGGSDKRIFLNLTRNSDTLYVGCDGETEIHKFNTSDMVKGTSITTPDNNVQNMRVDKEGVLTVISHNGTNTEVDRYDTNNSDTQLSNSIALPGTNLYTAMYFTIENYIVLGGPVVGTARITCYSLSGSTYTDEGYITTTAIDVEDMTVDVYNNVVWLDGSTTIRKAKVVGETGSTIYSSDRTDPVYGISTDSDGNYFFSTFTATDVKNYWQYADDNDASSFTSGNFTTIRSNLANKCFNVDSRGYDISGNGTAGR